MKRFILFFGLMFIGSHLVSQNVSRIFDEGKALFDDQQYALAQSKLAPITSLTEKSDKVRWASFYYAVSAFYTDDIKNSKNMFLQILNRYPDWEERNEVYFWIAYIDGQNNDIQGVFDNLARIDSPILEEDIENLKADICLKTDDLVLLKELLNEYPEEDLIASRMADLILAMSSEKRDMALLRSLEEQYNLTLSTSLGEVIVSPKKSVYNVGLFLPFYFRTDSASLVRITRSWTTDMYNGAQLAVEKLKTEGIEVNLVTYDTRGKTSLPELIRSGELDGLDLMVGPVTQKSLKQLSDFSKEKKITMVNPLSGNNEIIKENPYALLYFPSNESIARRAANYAKKHFNKNKTAAIFYSGIADKDRADLYKELIEQDSFEVVLFEGVRPDQSALIRQTLLAEEEVDKELDVIDRMKSKMDSLRRAGVRNWDIYDERDFVEDVLVIAPDSIGHIFLASDYSSLVTSALSGLDARPDTIQFMSTSRFLAAEQSISYAQLDRLDAVLLGSNHIDFTAPEVAEFRDRYVDKFLAVPTKTDRFGDAYLSYDLLVNYGRLLNKYGQYFQIGLKSQSDIKGELIKAFNYRFSQDNNFIPYLKVRGTKVEVRE